MGAASLGVISLLVVCVICTQASAVRAVSNGARVAATVGGSVGGVVGWGHAPTESSDASPALLTSDLVGAASIVDAGLTAPSDVRAVRTAVRRAASLGLIDLPPPARDA